MGLNTSPNGARKPSCDSSKKDEITLQASPKIIQLNTNYINQ